MLRKTFKPKEKKRGTMMHQLLLELPEDRNHKALNHKQTFTGNFVERSGNRDHEKGTSHLGKRLTWENKNLGRKQKLKGVETLKGKKIRESSLGADPHNQKECLLVKANLSPAKGKGEPKNG